MVYTSRWWENQKSIYDHTHRKRDTEKKNPFLESEN